MITLKTAKCGDSCTVVKLHGTGVTKRRIMDMLLLIFLLNQNPRVI